MRSPKAPHRRAVIFRSHGPVSYTHLDVYKRQGYECKWATNTVVHILENREYTGCLVNFKTEKDVYKRQEQYLLFEHDEFTMKPVLDETGRLIPREDYRLSTLNCDGEDLDRKSTRLNSSH